MKCRLGVAWVLSLVLCLGGVVDANAVVALPPGASLPNRSVDASTGNRPMDVSVRTSCTTAQRAKRAKALHKLVRRQPGERRAFFKHHHGAKARKRFVRHQKQELRAAKRAVKACNTNGSTPVAPPPSNTPGRSGAGCQPMLAPDAAPLDPGGFDLRSEGTLPAVAVFLDFADAPGTDTTQSVFDNKVAPVMQWYSRVSNGHLNLSITPVQSWVRMPKTKAQYDDNADTFTEDAINAADPIVDYSKFKLVYLITSDQISDWGGWAAGNYSLPNSNGNVGWIVATSQYGGGWGWKSFAHETGHTLGIVDYYFADVPGTDWWHAVGAWDVMSLPNGGDFFSWDKYQLGWLQSSQLVCVDAGSSIEQTIAPDETSEGTKAVIVKTGPSTADVVETRRMIGNDGPLPGYTGLCEQGVLVYEVDASKGGAAGRMVLKARNDASNAQCPEVYNALYGAALGPGQGYQDGQINVQVISDNADGSYTVRVTAK